MPCPANCNNVILNFKAKVPGVTSGRYNKIITKKYCSNEAEERRWNERSTLNTRSEKQRYISEFQQYLFAVVLPEPLS